MIIFSANKDHTNILAFSKASCAFVNGLCQSSFFHYNAFSAWQYYFIGNYQVKFRKYVLFAQVSILPPNVISVWNLRG